jgi:hypothetical protein
MRVTVSHNKSEQEAVRIVDETFEKIIQPDAAGPLRMTDITRHWDGPNMNFHVTARLGPVGIPIRGKVLVTDHDVTVDVELPWLLAKAVPEQQIQDGVERNIRGFLK